MGQGLAWILSQGRRLISGDEYVLRDCDVTWVKKFDPSMPTLFSRSTLNKLGNRSPILDIVLLYSILRLDVFCRCTFIPPRRRFVLLVVSVLVPFPPPPIVLSLCL